MLRVHLRQVAILGVHLLRDREDGVGNRRRARGLAEVEDRQDGCRSRTEVH